MASHLSLEQIARNYLEPGHPTAFSSPGVVHRYYGGQVSIDTIRKVLQSVDAYTLHREVKRPDQHNPFYSYQRRTNYQADLIDMSKLKYANSHYMYLLVIIDVFSRKLWVMPLKKKDAPSMVRALGHWIDEQDKEPGAATRAGRQLYTDRGKEFVARSVVKLLREHNFEHFTSQRGVYKAAVAERVNKTLQIKIYKYLSHTGRKKYVDVLPDLISSYNNAKHSTLENLFSPEEADLPENEAKVLEIHNRRYHATMEKMDRTRKKRRFKRGDLVRVILTKGRKVGPEGRAYTPYFSEQIYQVIAIKKRMPVPRYVLRSLTTLQTVPGSFYANELSKLISRLFKIEKVLETRQRDGKTYKLVKLLGLHKKFSQWVNGDNIDKNNRVRASELIVDLDSETESAAEQNGSSEDSD